MILRKRLSEHYIFECVFEGGGGGGGGRVRTERDRDRQRETDRETERQRDRERERDRGRERTKDFGVYTLLERDSCREIKSGKIDEVERQIDSSTKCRAHIFAPYVDISGIFK